MTLRSALHHRAYVAALTAGFAGDFVIVGTRSALVPQFITDRLGLGQGWVYAAFLAVAIVSGALLLPFGRMADSRGRRPVIVIGLALGAVGIVLLPSAPVLAGLLVAMALLGVAGAADSVAPGAMMGDVVAGRGGTVVAVFQMAGDLGAVLGPLAAGWTADNYGYPAAFGLAAVVALVPIPVVLRTPETLAGDDGAPAGAGESALAATEPPGGIATG